MGRYSNTGEMASHLGELANMVPQPSPTVRKSPKQVQHRLGSEEIDQLVAQYQAGAKVNDLAARFRINRYTVNQHIERAGVRLHYPALSPEEIEDAARLYMSGESLP